MSDWLADFVEREKTALPGLALDVARLSTGYVCLSRIVVPVRGDGTGTAIMRRLLALCDAHGATVVLTPTSDFGGSVRRLTRWYRSLGFTSNRGRSRTMSTTPQETMIRRPATN